MLTDRMLALALVFIVLSALSIPNPSHAKHPSRDSDWTGNVLNLTPLLTSNYRKTGDDAWYVGCVLWRSGHVVAYPQSKTRGQNLKRDGRVVGRIDPFASAALYKLIQLAAKGQKAGAPTNKDPSTSFSLFAWMPTDLWIPPTMEPVLLQWVGKSAFKRKFRPALQLAEWWSDLIAGTKCPAPGATTRNSTGLDKHLLKGPFRAFETDKGLYGYRSVNGAEVIAPKFVMAGNFLETGIAPVADKAGWKYIDRFERVVIDAPFIIDNAPEAFNDGYARYESDGKIGFFDRRGAIRIKATADFALPFSEGYAVYCLGCGRQRNGEHFTVTGGKWGYIDKRGHRVLKPQYDELTPFKNGLARGRKGKDWIEISLAKGKLPPDWFIHDD